MFIPLVESTIERPLYFFQQFYASDTIIAKIKKSFYPDLNDEHNWSAEYALTVNKESESYTIEYLKYQDLYDDNGEQIDRIQSSEVIMYNFEKELYKELKIQYFKSKELIEKAINNADSIEKVKLKIQIWIDLLSNWNSIFPQMKEFEEYRECVRPLHALVRYLNGAYPSFCPQPQVNFKLILEDSPIAQQTFEEKPSLSKTFFKELASLVDDKEEAIIELGVDSYKNEIDTNSKMLEQFFNNKYSSDGGTIYFKWGQEPICYLFSEFKNYGSSINLRQLEKSKKVKIKGEFYKAANADKNSFSFRKKSTVQKTILDELFRKHEK